MIVRPEVPAQYAQVRALLVAAFPTAAEADLVERLRDEGDAAIVLVALDGDEVIGHVVLSRMTAPMRALGLGPVAVRPDRQRQGIGRRLIDTVLEQARRDHWEAVFVVGEPLYYGRVGFSAEAAEGFETPYAGRYFMVLGLCEGQLSAQSGRISYAPAFGDLD